MPRRRPRRGAAGRSTCPAAMRSLSTALVELEPEFPDRLGHPLARRLAVPPELHELLAQQVALVDQVAKDVQVARADVDRRDLDAPSRAARPPPGPPARPPGPRQRCRDQLAQEARRLLGRCGHDLGWASARHRSAESGSEDRTWERPRSRQGAYCRGNVYKINRNSLISNPVCNPGEPGEEPRI